MANQVVEEKISEISKDATKNLGGGNLLEEELGHEIRSIINEDQIKTSSDEVNDLAIVIAKKLGIENSTDVKIEAKKIRLEVDRWKKENVKEVNDFKKEEFDNKFEEETKKLNPEIKPEDLKKARNLAGLVSETYFDGNDMGGQKDEALEANKEVFSPGKLETAWTDLQGITQFLKKSPKEIAEIVKKYNSLKKELKDVKLPNLKEGRSFEKVVSGFNDKGTNRLFSRTQKYLGWADRVDKLTGGWLNKRVTEAGLKFAGKIGNQAVSEFATNSLNVMAKEGFQKGFQSVLKGVLNGGVKAGTKAAGTAVAGGAAEAAGATAGAASGPWGWVAMAAIAVVGFVKKNGEKIAEKLGISVKAFLQENFGKAGGAIIGGISFLVGLPALIIGMLTTTLLLPFLIIGVSIGLIYQMTIGNLISSLLPPRGGAAYEEALETNNDITRFVTRDPTIFNTYKIGTLTYYVFEKNSTGGRISDRYDLGYYNSTLLGSVGNYALGSNNKLDSRVVLAYQTMVDEARASGRLSIPANDNDSNLELMLISGYRDRAEQLRLWNKALADYKDPKIASIWASNPENGLSAHATGRTIDIRVDGGCQGQTTLVCTARQRASSTFKWLQENAEKYGFYNYINTKTGISVEPWHWEYNPKDVISL